MTARAARPQRIASRPRPRLSLPPAKQAPTDLAAPIPPPPVVPPPRPAMGQLGTPARSPGMQPPSPIPKPPPAPPMPPPPPANKPTPTSPTPPPDAARSAARASPTARPSRPHRAATRASDSARRQQCSHARPRRLSAAPHSRRWTPSSPATTRCPTPSRPRLSTLAGPTVRVFEGSVAQVYWRHTDPPGRHRRERERERGWWWYRSAWLPELSGRCAPQPDDGACSEACAGADAVGEDVTGDNNRRMAARMTDGTRRRLGVEEEGIRDGRGSKSM